MLEMFQKFAMTSLGLDSNLSLFLGFVTLSFIVFLFCFLADFIARTYLVKLFNLLISKAYLRLSKYLKERGVVSQLSRLAPALVLYLFAPAFLAEGVASTEKLVFVLQQASLVYMIFTLTVAFFSTLDVVEDVYNEYEISKRRPIKSYLQIAKIIISLFSVVIFVSLLLDKSPLAFFTGLGAAATILVLIFKDSIMSFLAGVQVASYDMIRIGDWIEVAKYGADGDVIEIALTTVKVRNFDKTITTVPTSSLISEGVKNWRGMTESGGRRIKRSIRIDLNSIKLLGETDLVRFKNNSFLSNFLKDESKAFEAPYLTNIKLFRAYADYYLTQSKDIYSDKSFTFLIRELEPDENGLPVQVYIFTKTTNWGLYESIQADVIDHLLASLSFFDLRAYQNITGSDLERK